MNLRIWYNLEDTAQMLSLTTGYLRNKVRSGVVTDFYRDGRVLRFDPHKVAEQLVKGTQAGSEQPCSEQPPERLQHVPRSAAKRSQSTNGQDGQPPRARRRRLPLAYRKCLEARET